jgi:hypothetical protein
MEHASHEMKLILAECPNFTPTANDYLDATKSEHLHGNKYNNRALFALLLKKDPNHAVANEALNILVKKEFGPFNSGGFPEAKILIQHGVQVNEKNVNLAAQRGYLKMVELFFSAIPKEQHKSYGKALEIAERSWKTTSVVNYLKSLGIEKPGVKHAVNISTSSPERVTKSGNASPSVVMPNTPEQRAVLLGILARVAQANSQQTSTKPTATPTVSFAETKDKNPSEGQLYKAKSICSKDGRFTISANKRLLISDSISLVSDEQLEELGIVEFKRSRSGIDNYVTVEISRL